MMCDFDADTLRCKRCGYLARRLPTFRVCRTIHEMAEKFAYDKATRRIHIPPIMVGTAISSTLAKVGITPMKIKEVTGKDCGCDKRKATLDRIGAAASAVIERAANGIANAILPSSVEPDDVAAIATSLANSPLTNTGLREGPLVDPPPTTD